MTSILPPSELIVAKRAILGMAVALLSIILGLGGLFLLFIMETPRAFETAIQSPSSAAAMRAFVVTAGVQLMSGGLSSVSLFCNWRLAPAFYWGWVAGTILQLAAMTRAPLMHGGLAALALGVVALMILGGWALRRLYPTIPPSGITSVAADAA